MLRSLFRSPEHPLLDLQLFRNRALSVSVIAMSLFAMAFFGASLLFPSYFLQVRGESTLQAGLLLAPQGIGAMLTMPVAGVLTDKIGPGKIVITGITVIVVGMAMFTQVGVDTSYTYLLGALFIMGLGMGGTMMPIMTSALQTLRDHEIARGSTLMNITQQIAASIGTALFSVLLTNGFNSSAAVGQLRSALESPEGLRSLPDPSVLPQALADMADAFGTVFVVATVLVALCLVPALMLPRHPAAGPRGGRRAGAPALTAVRPPPTRHLCRQHARRVAARVTGSAGGLPDADAVLGVEPEAVAGLHVERLDELVEVAHDVRAELVGAVRVDGEQLEHLLLAALGAPHVREVQEHPLLAGPAADARGPRSPPRLIR